jgi:VCBS repeat-containing protein
VATTNVWTERTPTGEFDWVPPHAGVFLFFVRVHDTVGQSGQSGQISGYIDEPPAPSAVGNWGAQAGNEGFVIAITEEQGGTLQDTFTIRSAEGESQTFPIVNSTIQGNRATVHPRP